MPARRALGKRPRAAQVVVDPFAAASPAVQTVRYWMCRPEQIAARRESCPVAYIPIGTLEWHIPTTSWARTPCRRRGWPCRAPAKGAAWYYPRYGVRRCRPRGNRRGHAPEPRQLHYDDRQAAGRSSFTLLSTRSYSLCFFLYNPRSIHRCCSPLSSILLIIPQSLRITAMRARPVPRFSLSSWS